MPPLWLAEFLNAVVGQICRGALGLAAVEELVALTDAMFRDGEFAGRSRGAGKAPTPADVCRAPTFHP